LSPSWSLDRIYYGFLGKIIEITGEIENDKRLL